ncbi:hypothetical protein TBR22_A45880 [Luteitalea sp. TBR-22]|uniref:hypothetical protein n=1 Tax=Luteitalea sp. TBR-22 TaxID=2802971 RepID=UPI001AF3749C|nr:hypothetical protein [Luteitalea sp. TBR-22]BCS35361.1 hypothetical protein TBR22_A45880 [Luteitalea sp. TBR-22]
MTACCSHEAALVAAAVEGRSLTADLQSHLATCESCREVQALVSVLREDRDAVLASARMPSAAVVWWRAERRARAEAAAAAARPITVATGLAVASAIGVLASLAGILAYWGRGWVAAPARLVETTAVIGTGLASAPSALRLAVWLVAGALLVATPLAWYVATRDDA